MKFEIRSWLSGNVLFSIETESLRLAIEAAVKSRADLREADLRGADLRGADLGEADLREADLGEADLREADLGEADLGEADLREADLRGANLCGANLREADLCGANLREADLTPIRDDLWAVLSAAPREAAGLRKALLEGQVDGTCYEGHCACLVGTIANLQERPYTAIPNLVPNGHRPIERFFLHIKPGDTPDNSQTAKLAVEWIDLWLANMRDAFGVLPESKGGDAHA